MKNFITHNNIIPGMMNSEVEFFAVNEKDVKAIHQGQILSFEEFPEWVIELVKADMRGDQHSAQEIKDYIRRNFGALDGVADICENRQLNYSEYIDGVSKNLPLPNGNYLTLRQVTVLKLIHLTNQEIADTLFLSVESVKTHIQNIMRETGLSRVELGIFATKKGII